MGNCSSCLGYRRREDYDEDDESRLLFDDPNNLQYGSFNEQQMSGQDDPLEVQQEIEALQRVVARTSDNMVDIFEIAPPQNSDPPRPAPIQYVFPGQEDRLARYQTLLSKLSSEEASAGPPPAVSIRSTASTKIDWVPWDEDDNIEMQRGVPPVKAEAGEPLVGTFADTVVAITRQ